MSTFNPQEHIMQIKNRQGSSDYLPVQWRLVWFREHCPDGVIETEMIHLDLDRETEEEGYVWNNDTKRSEKIVKRANGIAIFRAVVKDAKGGIATATKSEKAASFPDFIEKAETGSVGRALAMLGYGTQFTGDEISEGHRIADAPVDRTPSHDNTRRSTETVKPSIHATAREQSEVAPSQPGSSMALTRMIEQAQARTINLGKSWEETKTEALGKSTFDADLVMKDFQYINGLLKRYEQEQPVSAA